MPFKKDLRLLLKPYYLINILLSVSYIVSKRVPIVCNYVFAQAECELDGVSKVPGEIINPQHVTKRPSISEGDRDPVLSHDSHNDKDTKDRQRYNDQLLVVQLRLHQSRQPYPLVLRGHSYGHTVRHCLHSYVPSR